VKKKIKAILQNQRTRKITRYFVVSVISLIIISLLIFGIYSLTYSRKVYGHTVIGQIDFKGKNKKQVEEILKASSDQFLKSSIILKAENSSYSFVPAELGVNYDIEKTRDNIWNYGRSGDFFRSVTEQLRSMFRKKEIQTSFIVNESLVDDKLNVISKEIDSPEKDYALIYDGENFILDDEKKEGKRIDKSGIKNQILKSIGTFSYSMIEFKANEYKPKISLEKAKLCLDRVNRILSSGNLTLFYETQEFIMDQDTIAAAIRTHIAGDDMEIVFDDDRIKLFAQTIGKAIDSEPKNVQLKVENGVVAIATGSKNGMTLDQEKTNSDIKGALISRAASEEAQSQKVSLKIEVKKPEISDTDIERLGLKELVGRGETNFVKSPANRVHNINVGANAINGTLLKPGETFSTLTRLGEIDASSGYLEELVIKENRTVPEFGGGLCQVSSTLFRAALNAGMEIVERRNHKYRVSYYEPPVGMDATIYDPSPDFKFKNNYESYVFVQSAIKGTKITFELYGTKDSRAVEISEPEIFDIVNPGPPIEIETETMAPGERKIIEKAHEGASAKFNYKVSKDGAILQQKEFFSKYVPWPEKWLVGKGVPAVNTNCQDSIQNGDEVGIDCGGSCPNACPAV